MTSFGERFCLTLITSDLRLAAEADRAGVNRIGIDLERIGKAQRQAGRDSRLSLHEWDDLCRLRKVVKQADLFVRTNPICVETEREVETALDLGARVLMLPSFGTAEEVSSYVKTVRGRAQVVILVELAPAVARIREILKVPGIDEVMLGLNDLHLQFGVSNHFEILASPVVDMLAAEVRRKGMPLGAGGVGRAGDSGLPVPSDLVYAQYPRLRATAAWIARSFCEAPECNFREDIPALRRRLNEWSAASPEALERAREDLARCAAEWDGRPRSSHVPVA